jgi:hypothetical protein
MRGRVLHPSAGPKAPLPIALGFPLAMMLNWTVDDWFWQR